MDIDRQTSTRKTKNGEIITQKDIMRWTNRRNKKQTKQKMKKKIDRIQNVILDRLTDRRPRQADRLDRTDEQAD